MTEEQQKTLSEFKTSEWYLTRPETIRKAIDLLPPVILYQWKTNKKQCYIIGYTEPNDKELEVTLIVQKTGIGGLMAAMGLSSIDKNQVFGVHINDLEPVNETEQ